MGERTVDEIPKSICEALLDVLVEFGLHAQPPRLIKPPRLVVALYEAADDHYAPVRAKLVERIVAAEEQLDEARTFLASVASADPQTEQAKWMVEQAREGLRRAGGHDFDASPSGGSGMSKGRETQLSVPAPASFRALGVVRQNHGTCRCGAKRTVEVIIQARPSPSRKGSLRTRSRTLCEPCAVEAFTAMELLLDNGSEPERVGNDGR